MGRWAMNDESERDTRQRACKIEIDGRQEERGARVRATKIETQKKHEEARSDGLFAFRGALVGVSRWCDGR